MEPLKDIYYPEESYKVLANELYKIYPKFDRDEFYKEGIKGLEDLELKQRITRVVTLFKKFLLDNYQDTLRILSEYARGRENNFYYLFLPEYVWRYGLDHYEDSMEALKEFTKFSSSEEAVRYFLLKDFDRTIGYMMKWAEDDNYHVRRLSSEGSRPRLPWTIKLHAIAQDPALSFPILEILKEDPEKYVQKSVANHLNDISKDNQDWLVDKISNWNRGHKVTSWIIGCGTRTLVKDGHKGCLELLGYDLKPEIKLEKFEVDNEKVKMGDGVEFSLALISKKQQKLVMDYRIYFMKKNGKQIAKTFKLAVKNAKQDEKLDFARKYKFQDLSTRKHYKGLHAVELLVNGNAISKREFKVI